MIDVWRGVVLVPMVGSLTCERINAIVTRLLPAVADRRATLARLDVDLGSVEVYQTLSAALADCIQTTR